MVRLKLTVARRGQEVRGLGTNCFGEFPNWEITYRMWNSQLLAHASVQKKNANPGALGCAAHCEKSRTRPAPWHSASYFRILLWRRNDRLFHVKLYFGLIWQNRMGPLLVINDVIAHRVTVNAGRYYLDPYLIYTQTIVRVRDVTRMVLSLLAWQNPV